MDFGILDRELKREIYKYSYYEFFKFCFRILFPNEVYRDSKHIKYLCDLFQSEVERIIAKKPKNKDLIINIPPRSSKSLIGSVCLLPWAWIHDPTMTFICVSFDDDLSMLNSSYSKDIIKNEEYQNLFGHMYYIRKDSDAKGFFMNNHGGFRMSKTTGSNITGHKGIMIICDDIQNPSTAESEQKRKTSIQYYTQALYNRLTPVDIGLRVNIQQRLHEEDVTGYLLANDPDDYHLVCLPAEISKDVQPAHLTSIYTNGLLDPNRLSIHTLQRFKKVLGSRGYAGQYSQTPFDAEGNIIKREWLEIIEASSLTRDVYNSPIHFFIDGAYTEKTANDPSAILACYKQDGKLIIVGVEEVWMEFPSLCRFIVEYVNKFEYSEQSFVFVEPKASGKSVVQQLLSTTSLNVVEANTPKDDKVTRTHAQTPKMEAKRVKLVRGHWNTKFINQLLAFPTGLHDDMLDCLTMSLDHLFDEVEAFM